MCVFAFSSWTVCDFASWLVPAALWQLFASSAECRRSCVADRLHSRRECKEKLYKEILTAIFLFYIHYSSDLLKSPSQRWGKLPITAVDYAGKDFVCMCYWVVHACRVGAFWAKWNDSILFYLDDVVLSIVTLPLASRLDAWQYHFLGTTHRIPIFWHVLCTHSIPSATMHGYLDIKVFESWAMKPFRVLDYPMSVWILQGLALLTVSLCSDHYQLSCPSRFLSFFPPVWNEPSGAVCRILFNYIKQPMLILPSHHVPCLAQLHFKWDFNITTPKTAHPLCLYLPFARLIFLPSSPSVIDFVTGWCVISCSTY